MRTLLSVALSLLSWRIVGAEEAAGDASVAKAQGPPPFFLQDPADSLCLAGMSLSAVRLTLFSLLLEHPEVIKFTNARLKDLAVMPMMPCAFQSLRVPKRIRVRSRT